MDFEVYDFSFSENTEEDSNIIKFYWDRKFQPLLKNSIDLKDIFLFYDVKSFQDLMNFLNLEKEQEYFSSVKNTIVNITNSFIDSKISFEKIEEVVPDYILNDYHEIKLSILEKSVKYIQGKKNYEKVIRCFLNSVPLEIIRKMNYNVDLLTGIKEVDLLYAKNFRFKSNYGSLNLFNMPIQERKIVYAPSDYYLLACDYRQFEFRTFLRIHPRYQNFDFSVENIYDFLAEEISLEKDEAKVQLIAFMYGKNNDKIKEFINTDLILEQIDDEVFSWEEYSLFVNPSQAAHKKLHTIVQTIAQYEMLNKLQAILGLLAGKKSLFIYPLHDELIFNIHKEELFLIEEIENIMVDDVYKIKKRVGKNLLETKEFA